MDERISKRSTSYDRVMPRVYTRSRPNPKANTEVTRHGTSATRVGAKESSSNISSSVFCELPLVLGDYEPERPVEKPKVLKAKPRKTIKSLDPGKSPHSVRNQQELKNNRALRVRNSAPCVIDSEPMGWSDSHLRQCYSSRSHTRLKELKDEIKAFQKTQKLLQLRSHLYKKCGVVLDDAGGVAEDKAVQVHTDNFASGDDIIRTERGEDDGAAVSDEQMRPAATPYPVDRYLVESRKQIDIVNIIDDDIWNPEPALRPEDEILLRKLHDMLQTTADDLKLLSGELSKYHEPSVQVKTLPTPLDEEFNEKVHIEEVVNAKFYGSKIIDRTQASQIPRSDATDSILRLPSRNDMNNAKKTKYNSGPTSLPLLKKPVKKKLQMSRINTVEIKEKSSEEKQIEKPIMLNNVEPRKCVPTQAVAYSEISHEYIKSNAKEVPQKSLKIQEMPTINIRSELRLQNVMKLDIIPESKDTSTQHLTQQNALVIEMQHEPPSKPKDIRPIKFDDSQYITLPTSNRLTTRKISKMTAYESSESNNVSSDTIHRSQKQTQGINSTHIIEKKASQNTKKNNTIAKKVTSRPQAHLEEWKRKLNTVYGRPASSKTSDRKKKIYPKSIIKKPNSSDKIKENKEKNLKNQIKSGLNNTEYIPYSKLTLGGVNVSDIEREISNIPNKNNVVLSPILDKILSSRENSFNNDSPRKSSQVKSPKILTTSDENLLQEVLDIEMKVTKTLNNKNNDIKTTNEIKNNINDSTKDESYADDFEDDKTDASEQSKRSNSETSKSSHNIPSDFSTQDRSNNPDVEETSQKTNENNRSDNNNLTFTKAPTLSFKNKVDIFEFVHAIDKQDTGTQSITSNKIIPKETQTSPRGDNSNVQPIHNDLWPSLDPKGEVEKMLKLEKEFIKKLIIEEYGDLLEKSLNKPSTSGNTEIKISEKNVAASQKITQTSPAHMKSVMTSPPRTKTRTTSPFALSVTVYQQTSPIIAEEELKIELGNEDDLAISANLSSPRFSLRLPQTSRDVLSNLKAKAQNNKKALKYDNMRKHIFSSSSSVDGDYSSSDISSLGEINKKFKRLRKNRVPSLSEISTSSSQSKYSSDPSGPILPLRSEGEASVGRVNRKMTNKSSKSEGEVSLGQLR